MSKRPHFSVVIPYYNRLPYLQRALKALSEQDVPFEDFEIVIGCLEYSESLSRALTDLPLGLRARCTMTRESWNVARARNIAIANTEGEVLVILDADMLIPRSFLRHLRDNHDLGNRDCAVVGQMLNYSAHASVTEENLLTYEYYRDAYLSHNRRDGLSVDSRWTTRRQIPWSYCWTAVMALPHRLVEKYSLFFDETFTGWGAEDLEWGYRIQRSGIPIAFADDLWGIHLPHLRCASRNFAEEQHNFQIFLRKWPCFEVEVVARFGCYFANQRFDELARIWHGVCGQGRTVLSVGYSFAGSHRLAVGVLADDSGRLLNADQIPDIGAATITRRVPMMGLLLPYGDHSLHTAYFLSSLRNVPPGLYVLIRSEMQRIAGETVVM